jgi:hypothetical protein
VFMMTVVAITRTSLGSLRYFREPNADPRMRVVSLALFAGLVGFCVSGTFLTQGLNWPFYVLLGLTVAMRREREVEQSMQLGEAAVEPSAPVRKLMPQLSLVQPSVNRSSRP